jgi:hypothetical protein
MPIIYGLILGSMLSPNAYQKAWKLWFEMLTQPIK